MRNHFPLRLLLAVAMAAPSSFLAVPAFAGEKKKPRTYTPDVMHKEYQVLLQKRYPSGSYGRASEIVGKIYEEARTSEERKLRKEVAALVIMSGDKLKTDLAAAGATLDKIRLEEFLADKRNHSASSVLLDAMDNDATRGRLLEMYAAFKDDPRVKGDFMNFLRLVSENFNSDKEPKLLHQIIKGAVDPEAEVRKKEEKKRENRQRTAKKAEEQARSFWLPGEIYGKKGDRNFKVVDGRHLTFNIVTFKNADGVMTQRIAVYDVTNVSDIHGWTFALDDPRLRSGFGFQLDDRPHSVNAQTYSIQLVPSGGDIRIIFKGGTGAAVPVPSVKELFRLRAKKVRDTGYIVAVGGKEFYLGGEGHSGMGQNTYWDKSMLDKIDDPDFNPMKLVPAMASMAVRRQGGLDVPVAKSYIGEIGGKHYYQVWNKEEGVLDTAEGPPPPPPGSGAGGIAGGPGGFPTFPGLNAHRDSAVAGINRKLDAMGAGLRLYKEDGATRFILADKTGGNSFIPMVGKGDGYSFELTGDGVLIASDKGGTVYIRVTQGLRQRGTGEFGRLYGLGKWQERGQVFSGTDVAFYAKALARSGFEEEDIRKIVNNTVSARLDSRGETFTFISSNWDDDKKAWIEFGDRTKRRLWPDLGIPVAVSLHPDDVEIIGPSGIIIDKAQLGLSQFAAFSQDAPVISVGGASAKVAVVREGKGAQLYRASAGGRSEWFLKFVVRTPNGDQTVSNLIKVFEDPAEKNSRTEFPVEDVFIHELNLAAVPKRNDLEVRIINSPGARLKEKGVLAVFDMSAASVRNKGLLGVIGYWGVDKKTAEALAEQT